MHSIRGLLAASVLAYAGTALAMLSFDTDATLHDYPSLADGSAKNNPPFCAMSYDSLDLNSITSYCAINRDTCGACLNVCGSKGCKYLLAMDRCTRTDGLLDMSMGAGQEIGGATTGHLQVSVTQVEASYCQHIWNGKMFYDWDPPYGSLAGLKSIVDNGPTSSYDDPATKVPVLTSYEPSSVPATTTSSAEEPVSQESVPEMTAGPTVSTTADSEITSESSATTEAETIEPSATIEAETIESSEALVPELTSESSALVQPETTASEAGSVTAPVTSKEPTPAEIASSSIETTASDSALIETETASSGVAATNGPWSVPITTLFSSLAPFGNSSIASTATVTVSLSASAAIPTDDSSETEDDAGADSNGSGGSTAASPSGGSDISAAGESEDCVTITSTIPGSTIYYTVTIGNADGNSINEVPSSTTEGLFAETAASDLTTKATTTVRSTSTIWYIKTTTITGCPPGVTDCPESLQTTGTSTMISAVRTTVVASAYATLYPSGPGRWNGTASGGSHDAVNVPNAQASAGAYAANLKERHDMAAPMPHAKRSAAPSPAGSQGWEAIMALGGLTALVIMAL